MPPQRILLGLAVLLILLALLVSFAVVIPTHVARDPFANPPPASPEVVYDCDYSLQDYVRQIEIEFDCYECLGSTSFSSGEGSGRPTGGGRPASGGGFHGGGGSPREDCEDLLLYFGYLNRNPCNVQIPFGMAAQLNYLLPQPPAPFATISTFAPGYHPSSYALVVPAGFNITWFVQDLFASADGLVANASLTCSGPPPLSTCQADCNSQCNQSCLLANSGIFEGSGLNGACSQNQTLACRQSALFSGDSNYSDHVILCDDEFEGDENGLLRCVYALDTSFVYGNVLNCPDGFAACVLGASQTQTCYADCYSQCSDAC